MTECDDPPVFSIGLALGDRSETNQAWKAVVTKVMNDVADLRAEVQSPLRLNVVFFVEGKLIRNDFEGVRTGRFSKKGSHLLVQAAIPTEPVGDRREVVLTLLSEAITEAEGFARRRGLAESLDEIRAIADRVGIG